jgi:steroid 5-alpha reductase family enzyme
MLPRLLLISAAIQITYMTLAFVVARRRRRLDTVDIIGTGGLVAVAWLVVYVEPAIRTYMAAAMVTAWSCRLFVVRSRRQRRGLDHPLYMQAAKAWVHPWRRALPRIYWWRALFNTAVGVPLVCNAGIALPGLRLLFTLGYVVWALGFYLAYRADNELDHFLTTNKKPQKVLNTGLWRYSRHPNYFGEALQWWGIGVLAAQTSFGWLGLAGSLLVTAWAYRMSVKTALPAAGKKAAKANREYQEYVRKTSAFVLLPPKE